MKGVISANFPPTHKFDPQSLNLQRMITSSSLGLIVTAPQMYFFFLLTSVFFRDFPAQSGPPPDSTAAVPLSGDIYNDPIKILLAN